MVRGAMSFNSPQMLNFDWTKAPRHGDLPEVFLDVCARLFEPAGLMVSNPVREEESAEYGAVTCALDCRKLVFRQAKTTPKKIGQFVTLWKREAPESEISPFDGSDGVDMCVIASFEDEHRGVFIFNSNVLARNGITSIEGNGGKRAFRVYAPWTRPVVKQALRTQNWQTRCFVDFGDLDAVETNVAALLQGA